MLLARAFRIPYIAMAYAYEVARAKDAPDRRRACAVRRELVTISEFSRQAILAHAFWLTGLL